MTGYVLVLIAALVIGVPQALFAKNQFTSGPVDNTEKVGEIFSRSIEMKMNEMIILNCSVKRNGGELCCTNGKSSGLPMCKDSSGDDKVSVCFYTAQKNHAGFSDQCLRAFSFRDKAKNLLSAIAYVNKNSENCQKTIESHRKTYGDIVDFKTSYDFLSIHDPDYPDSRLAAPKDLVDGLVAEFEYNMEIQRQAVVSPGCKIPVDADMTDERKRALQIQ